MQIKILIGLMVMSHSKRSFSISILKGGGGLNIQECIPAYINTLH